MITLPYLPGLITLLNLIFFNLLIPCLLCFLFLSRSPKPLITKYLLFLFACICYLAFTSSLVEFGENMRFRVSVEPLLWLSSFLALLILFQKLGIDKLLKTGESIETRG